ALSCAIRQRPTRSCLFPYPPLFRSIRWAPFDGSGRPRKASGSKVVAPRKEVADRNEIQEHDDESDRGQPRGAAAAPADGPPCVQDRKSTRLNSSHVKISYAVFCLKK